MDCQTLLYSVLLVVLCFIGGCQSQTGEVPTYQCYDCTYYKGIAEMNPNCLGPESSAAVREDCEICSTRIYRNANHTRAYIRRYCTRACTEGQMYSVNYQDLQNAMATEYCCEGNLCNTGNGVGDSRPTVVNLLITLISCGLGALLLRVH